LDYFTKGQVRNLGFQPRLGREENILKDFFKAGYFKGIWRRLLIFGKIFGRIIPN